MEYKIQAVKLAKELGGAKAAAKPGILENTMYAWKKAAREGRLEIGSGSHTPEIAMSLAQEPAMLRKQRAIASENECNDTYGRIRIRRAIKKCVTDIKDKHCEPVRNIA